MWQVTAFTCGTKIDTINTNNNMQVIKTLFLHIMPCVCAYLCPVHAMCMQCAVNGMGVSHAYLQSASHRTCS